MTRWRPLLACAAALVVALLLGGCAVRPAAQDVAPAPTTQASHTAATTAAPASRTPATSTPARAHPTVTAKAAPRPAKPKPATTRAAAPPAPAQPNTPQPEPVAAPLRGQALPLGYGTGNATQVITVAGSPGSTTATLQAWTKAPGGGWLAQTGQILAHVGSDGLATPQHQANENWNATPIGSFTLTQAFGALSNPGTALPYTHTDASDWWISQYGGQYTAIYNTMQSCWSNCPFNQGAPNEHLVTETPYYNYAVVIDYNRWPVVQGGGSAYFLHVTDGTPTAGCVAIPQGDLVSIMQWLNPAAHPRILIGTP